MIQYSTEIEIGGVIIRDPVTALTNILIFATGVACYLRLRKQKLEFPNRNWIYFFLLMGVSSLIGVVVHGFSYYTPPEVHFKIWWAMCVVQGAGITLAQIGFATNVFVKFRALVISAVTLQFGVFATVLYIAGTFNVAKAHIAVGLIPIMLYYIYKGKKGLKPEMMVAMGIGIASLTAIVHSMKLTVNQWVNYNDIAHVLIMASLFVIYTGVNAGLTGNAPATSRS